MSFQSVARTFRNWESEPGKLKEAERLVKVGFSFPFLFFCALSLIL